jgi:hypothetical protein
MTLVRLGSLIGVGLLVLVVNVGMTILYMVVYGHLINPGHAKEFYEEHVKAAAPYCSIVAGIPLMFLAGLWVAGWRGGSGVAGAAGPLGVKAALVVWLAYAVVDLSMVLAAGAAAKEGMNMKIIVLVAVSLFTKFAAAYAGALVATRHAAA